FGVGRLAAGVGAAVDADRAHVSVRGMGEGRAQPASRSRRSQTSAPRAMKATPTTLKPGRPPWKAPAMNRTPAPAYSAAVTWGGSPLDFIDQLLASAGTGKRKAGLLPGLVPRPGRTGPGCRSGR